VNAKTLDGERPIGARGDAATNRRAVTRASIGRRTLKVYVHGERLSFVSFSAPRVTFLAPGARRARQVCIRKKKRERRRIKSGAKFPALMGTNLFHLRKRCSYLDQVCPFYTFYIYDFISFCSELSYFVLVNFDLINQIVKAYFL